MPDRPAPSAPAPAPASPAAATEDPDGEEYAERWADEALWRARVHSETPASALPPAAVAALLEAARAVMAEALDQGGTSFDALYVNVNGESGYFDRTLDAYGRTDQPCRRCGTPITRQSFMNRSSFSCPTCQPAP